MPKKRRGRGEGQIKRHKNGWAGSVSCGYDNRTGKRNRIYVYGKTKTEVLKKLREVDPTKPPAHKQTLAAFIADWLQHTVKPSRAPSTYTRYEQLYRLKVKPHFHKQLAAVTRADVIHWLRKLQAKGVTPAGRHKALTLVSTAMTEAVRHGYIPFNPCQHIDKPKLEVPDMSILDATQVRQLLDAAAGDRLNALFRLALDSGMRSGELLALRWTDISFDDHTVSVQRALEEIAGKVRVKDLKSKRSRRLITLASSTIDALAEHRKHMLREGLRSDYVFVNTRGGFLRRPNIMRRHLAPLLEQASLPRLRFHDLRHTSISLLLGSGENIKVVSERAGHADVATTLRVYSHVLPTMQRQAARKMEELLG